MGPGRARGPQIQTNPLPECPSPSSGLTKREFFAGMALAGFMAYPEHTGDAATAKFAFEVADAMLAESAKGAKGETQEHT